MAIFVIIVISLIIGGIIGARIGGNYYRSQNYSLLQHIGHLKSHNQHWSNEARDKYTLVSQIDNSRQTNLVSTMQAVIHLMGVIQQTNTLNSKDQQAIDTIINSARGISARSEFE